MGGDGWTKLSEVVMWEEMVGPNFQKLWWGRRWLDQTFRGCGGGGDGWTKLDYPYWLYLVGEGEIFKIKLCTKLDQTPEGKRNFHLCAFFWRNTLI